MNQGFHDLSAEDYHADPCDEPSLSSTIANRLLSFSPGHAWYAHPRLNPAWQPAEPTSEMNFGSALHAALLERDTSIIEVVEADDWRTKAAKEARDAARFAGRIPILEKQFEQITDIVKAACLALDDCPELEPGLLQTGTTEQSLVWVQGGCWNRARLDFYSPDVNIVLDYKTTTNANPDYWIKRQLSGMGYDVQAAHYLDGIEAITGKRPMWLWLVQETKEPYACSIIGAGESTLDLGARKIRRARELFAHCLQTNDWPFYPNRICWSEANQWDLEEARSKQEQAEEDEFFKFAGQA